MTRPRDGDCPRPGAGAAFYVLVKAYRRSAGWNAHLVIFGALVVLIVILLPGGLVEAWQRLARRATRA